MIQTIKNSNGKVVGLHINGKNFLLSKDICHALALEEKNNEIQSQTLLRKAKETSSLIFEKDYIEYGDLINCRFFFDKRGGIDSNRSIVEFNKELSPSIRSEVLEVLNDFISLFNKAQASRENFSNDQFENTFKKVL